MEYRRLGHSGLKVSGIGLGGNNFGRWVDEQTSIAIINQALDMGVNFVDTADLYGAGQSEEIIGKAVGNRRPKVIIATKFGNALGKGPNDGGGSRHYMLKAVEASLKHLDTDYIDLYQMHLPDSTTPIEETLRALDDLIKSGKVRYAGCSNFAAWQLCKALWTSDVHNLNSFITVQSRYNVLEREIEKELVPCCLTHSIGVIPWAPLLGGFLSGKYRRDEKMPSDGRLLKPMRSYDKDSIFTEANWNKLEKLEAFASKRGHTAAELAVAWLLAKPWVSTVIAGARNADQVSANVAAGNWRLNAAEVTEVDNITA